MLHEMCHIGSAGYGHGPRFQRKLKRLDRLGESLAGVECAVVDGSGLENFLKARGVHIAEPIPLKTHLRWDMEALAQVYPRKPWRSARFYLVVQYPNTLEGSVEKLERLAPWAEARVAAALPRSGGRSGQRR